MTDLQANYDELLALFSQHEASANDCRLALEKKLQEALSLAKVNLCYVCAVTPYKLTFIVRLW